MSQGDALRDEDRLESPLRDAVDAVCAESIPDAAVERSVIRALQVATVSGHNVRLSKPHQQPWLANRRRWLVTAAGAGAAVVVAGIFWIHSPRSVLADVAKAVAEQAWMRAVGKGPNGVDVEMWFSPRHGIYAARQSAGQATETIFANIGQETIEVYVDEDAGNAFLSRVPMEEGAQRLFASQERTLETLFFGDPVKAFGGGRCELLNHTQKTARDGDDTFIEHRFTTKAESDAPQMVTVLRVDAKTRLPVSWMSTIGQKQVFSCQVDYLDHGPQTIYAMDVPADVEVVDQTPPKDLERILAAWKAGRTRFDSYRAVVVESDSPDHRAGGWIVYQVWRKGLRWRVEQLRIPPKRGSGPFEDEVPPDAEPKNWWLNGGEQWEAVPKTVSDGTVEIRLQVICSNPRRPDPENPRYLFIKSLEPHRTNAFSVSTADPRPDHYWLMPEFKVYPFLFGGNGFGYKRNVETHSKDGPEGTVLVESRMINAPKLRNRLRGARYWADPAHGYVVQQVQWLKTGKPEELPNGVVEMRELALSPNGLWYPGVVRVEDSVIREDGTRSDTYYRFYVDFAADIPGELFDVHEWGPIK